MRRALTLLVFLGLAVPAAAQDMGEDAGMSDGGMSDGGMSDGGAPDGGAGDAGTDAGQDMGTGAAEDV